MTPAVHATETESPAAAALRVLVVDDNRDAAEMLSGLLLSKGHAVAVAYSGDEAIRVAATFRPQVGLLDLSMPGLDGYQLATLLRSDERHRDVLLVAITGWGQEEDRRRALASGFDAHLTKPADPSAVTALLATRLPAAGERDSAAS
jgi:CheY-like chemotaxis protein